MAACIYLSRQNRRPLDGMAATLFSFLLLVLGSCFYFYEPISGMTNPPMEWGYPRTVEGFWHAMSRGQYDKLNPTDIFSDPGHFMTELSMLFSGWPTPTAGWRCFSRCCRLFFIFKMQKRERSWIISVAAIYPFLGVMLSIFLSPTRPPNSRPGQSIFHRLARGGGDLDRLRPGFDGRIHGDQLREVPALGFAGAGVAIALALVLALLGDGGELFRPGWQKPDEPVKLAALDRAGLRPRPVRVGCFASLMLVGMTLVFLASLFIYNQRAPLGSRWRFCPDAALLRHVALVQERAAQSLVRLLVRPRYVHSALSWGRTATDLRRQTCARPPPKARKGKMVYPEMARDAVLFGGTDPGRFCPTYTIFCESFIPHDCQPEQDQHYDRRDVYIITQNALADNTYLDYIRAQYNRSAQIDPPFFQNFLSGSFPKFSTANPVAGVAGRHF
jgi:hypothetical protein